MYFKTCKLQPVRYSAFLRVNSLVRFIILCPRGINKSNLYVLTNSREVGSFAFVLPIIFIAMSSNPIMSGLKNMCIQIPPPPQHFSLRISAGGWGSLGRGAPAFTHWYFSFRALIKSSYLKMQKMYCQQIFPFEQLPYRFLSLFNFDLKLVRSSMQSTFSKHSSKLSLPSAILNLCDEYLTSL